MKDVLIKIILIFSDLIAIAISISLAFFIKIIIIGNETYNLYHYFSFFLLYVIVILNFLNEGIYAYRYDFWYETKLILKSLFFSLIIIFAYLAITKSNFYYSRAVIVLSFICMSVILPLSKLILKNFLFNIGLWKKRAKIYNKDYILQSEIFNNKYIGYIEDNNQEIDIVFINSKNKDLKSVKRIIETELVKNREVFFIPLLNSYDLTTSIIYRLSNSNNNIILLKNRLKSNLRIFIKKIFDTILTIIILPLIFPIFILISILIKKDEPNGKIFFKQKRLGKNGKIFICYKFRTMYENSNDLLEKYLKEHPEEIEFYNKYHKYKNDPRITKIGHFLRRTSLDELPQIINILKNEMSLIGPRPYLPEERIKIGKDIDMILSVKPGITGLWQVSGRNNLDFKSRVKLDIWYVKNWNLWIDLEILLKTIKVVLKRDGAL